MAKAESKPRVVLSKIGDSFKKRGATVSFWGGRDGSVWKKSVRNRKVKWSYQTRVLERGAEVPNER